MYLLEQLFYGLCQGSIYALLAIGYSMIVGVTGLVTFTYGEVVMIGAYTAYYAMTGMGANVLIALILAFAASGLLGASIFKVCYERFLTVPTYISLVCTIGFSMIIKSLAQIFFGGETKGVPPLLQGYVELGGIRLSYLQIFIFAVVIVLSTGLTIFLLKTKAGMVFRSVSQNRKAAALLGVNVKRVMIMGNVIGCALAGVGGCLLALYYTNVSPLMGGSVGLKAFSSSVLGGLNNVAGAAGGGIIIGVFENLGIMLIGTGLRDAISFVFLLLVLLIKPQGLFGRKGVVKL